MLHGRSQMRRGVMEAPSRFRSNLTEAMMMFKVDDDADNNLSQSIPESSIGTGIW